jgi:type IV pilus assembly protein PilQ
MLRTRALTGFTLTVVLWLAAFTATPAPAADSNAMDRVGMTPTGQGTFSIDVEGADIRTVVRAISEFSGRNIVVGKEVRVTVRANLRNVSWQSALRTVCRSNGLDYVDEGGILRVDDAAKLQAERVDREAARQKADDLAPLETRIIRLNFANASEMAVSLTPSLTRRGNVQVEKRTNSLIVSDLPERIDSVERMATELDEETTQIEITAKLVDVDAEALRDMGVIWNAGGGDQPGEIPSGAQSPLNPGNDGDNTLRLEQTESIANPSFQMTYGIVKSWGSLEAQLQMLEQDRKANIISNPRITTVENREAKILVGQKIPLIVQDVAGNPVSQLQTIGIQLLVTPQLTDDSKIILDLHPEVSDLSTQATVQGGVIINTSEADTRVMVENGQTAVIGGLIRQNESTIRRGVPILKDVPLIGYFFRSENKIRQNRELIIFITPRIIESVAMN